MGNLKYGKYTEETAAEEAAENESGSILKFKVGKNRIRIVPPPRGQRSPFRVVYQHYIETGPNEGRSVVCARIESKSKKKCIICEKMNDLQKSSSAADRKYAEKLFPRKRIYVNVIERRSGRLVTAAIPKGVHDTLLGLRGDSDAGGDYVDPVNGFDIIVTRVGTGKNDTKYTCALAHKSTPLDPDENTDVMQEWIDGQAALEKYAALPLAQEVKQLLAGDPDGDDDDEDEGDRPRRKSKKSSDDDDDEDEGDRPRSKSKGKSKKSSDDDDDDDDDDAEDEDDEDEEPAPKKKSKPASRKSLKDDEPAPKKKKKKRSIEDDALEGEIEDDED